MTQFTPTGRVIARIQRLCCLGLDDQIVIPQLLRELHDLVPSHSNTFFWAGPQQQLVNMYADAPGLAELTPLYLQEYHNRREREVLFTFTELMRTNYASPAGDLLERILKVPHREFFRGDMYNLIWRPVGWSRMVLMKIADHGPGTRRIESGPCRQRSRIHATRGSAARCNRTLRRSRSDQP